MIIYRWDDIASKVQSREGERKLGETLHFLGPEEELDDLPACVARGAKYALIGIPESIGAAANLGRCCTDHAWSAFLHAFLNMQDNRFLRGKDILCLGHVKVDSLNGEAGRTNGADALRALCATLDDRVYPVVQAVAEGGLIPIVIGGGHNNAFPILKGVAAVRSPAAGIQCVNCDPHTDFRPLEGRHSGNAFSYAYREGFLRRYFVLGLHESYNSDHIIEQINANPDIAYSRFDEIPDMAEHIQKAVSFLRQSDLPVGIELDMDSMIDMPSSAMTPSGFRVEEARQYVRAVAAAASDPVYLHLPEGAPTPGTSEMIKVGKTLAYLATDFMKACKRKEGI
jgi:formiminoglutamase